MDTNSSVRTAIRCLMPVLAMGLCLMSSSRVVADDGITLSVSKGPLPAVALQWTGGAPIYYVFGNTIASTVAAAPNELGQTTGTSWVDTPPPALPYFYLVTNTCPPGTTACGSGCADLATDAANCGTCGFACTLPNAVDACSGGNCVVASCTAGFADLDLAAGNGCEYACPVYPPSTEVCNGVDDNCEGTVDEGNPGGGLMCTTGKLGICSLGVTQCSVGAILCHQNQQPTAEVCDGLDNDCNGAVDDGDPGGGSMCATGKLGICALGVTQCSGGAILCHQNQQPSAEVCDGLDNDCNGAVDEGNPGGGLMCTTGKLGVCALGVTQCSGGAILCQQNQQPSAEVCDGLDNNCDGAVDEGNPGGGFACTTGKLGICALGVTQCAGGAILCHQNQQPIAEICNGLDDNCDGAVDNGATCPAGQSCIAGSCH